MLRDPFRADCLHAGNAGIGQRGELVDSLLFPHSSLGSHYVELLSCFAILTEEKSCCISTLSLIARFIGTHYTFALIGSCTLAVEAIGRGKVCIDHPIV